MKIISLFCGAGGMDLGFIKAGHKIVWANDNDQDSIDTYSKYFKRKYNASSKHISCADITDVIINDIPDGDVVIGGFPCQGFSIANPYRKEKDSRNTMYLELLRVIKGKNPKYFVAENVPGLCSIGGYDNDNDRKEHKGKVLKVIIKELENATKIGYTVNFKILNAADYGVPQNRKRIIILGTRNDISKKLSHPKQTHINPKKRDLDLKKLKVYKSVEEAILDLPEPGEKKGSKKILNHIGTKHRVKINGFIGNRKTDPKKPSPTIVGRGGGTGGPVIIPHPNGNRRMTVRETARLQSFPDDFEFIGSISSCYRQIGNAVPWPLAYHIAKMIPKK
jgi:DNA (cytosine-5)-methyltransferase 1